MLDDFPKESRCTTRAGDYALTRGNVYPILAVDTDKKQVKVKDDVGRSRWYRMDYFDLDGTSRSLQSYEVSFEAELWLPGWDVEDEASLAFVTFADGTHWWANFVTYKFVSSQAARNQQNAHCLSGVYFWMEQMILVDQITRDRVETVVAELLAEGEFERAFAQNAV